MKDNSLDGHRGKVALSDTTRNAARNSTVGLKCELKTPPATSANDGTATTNFDDDYNEWELGIGDLIIDLDADIEKTNERNGNAAQQGIPSHQNHHPRPNDTATSPGSGSATAGNSSIVDSPNSASAATTFNFLGTQTSCNNNLAAAMSNSKSPRLAVNSAAASGTSGSAAGVGAVTTGSNGASTGAAGTFEHQATVDKGLKMKIKRKTVGSKYSEAKHEIVQSDTKSASHNSSENTNNVSNNSSSSASASNSPATNSDTPKSKHSSSKGRNSSHREKKEKNRDKDKNSSARSTSTTVPEVNGVSGGVLSPMKLANSDTNVSSPAPPSLCSNAVPSPVNNTSVASPSVPRSLPAAATTAASSPVSNSVPDVTQPPSVVSLSNQTVCASSSSPPMPNLTVKLEHKFTPSPSSQSCPVPSVVIKAEERPDSPPLKKIKLENADGSDEVERPGSPSPERKDTSTCTTSTSVGTITEPDCLGPCEPGTSVTLEGIVWQETEGGVLVVNVTWRGKTYVGTLLDCTKHDWAPPRFCESPTSDVDSKTGKGRGKRGRGGNNSSSEIASFTDTRNVVQSKLRNGKGRRTTINSNAANSGFTVPSSPAKNEATTNGGTKRKGRPNDTEASTPVDSKTSKRSRNQKQQQTPAAASPVPSASPAVSTEPPPSSQPSSPQWITCPEPNCSKRYKHINGLKYHKAHAHSSASDGTKMEDTATEDSSKDVTNSSDNEESMQESASVSTSPAPSFANAVPTAGKILLNESASSSSSSSVNGLPETDPYSLTTDLSTLASVAIGDSATSQKVANTSRIAPPTLHSSASQDISVVSSDGDSVGHSAALPVSVSNGSPNPAPLSDMLSSSLSTSEGAGLSVAVSAVTTSVIQSSNSLDNVASSQAVSMNIPTPHVNFSQGLLASNSSATNTFTTSTVVCNNSNSLSPSISHLSTNVTTTFAAISSITSTSIASPTTPLPMIDKSKIKQEKPDKYKPKSPLGTSPIRPIIPAPTPLIALSTNMPGTHPGMNIGSHCVGASLKPIQPKPTILGEPSTVNPSLEALKKDKSKHKKKSKDKERGDKKIPTLPLTPTKLGMNPGEDCEALELTSYPSLEAVSGPIPTSHPILSPLISQSKPPETSMDLSLPEDTMNDNVQSPAYSDISDANDTAPVLESEVPSGKEKEDKVGKSTPDASQSPATNISAYGMYPYYSQPPYLLPSVSPQAAASQGPNIMDKNEMNKKSDSERVKERPWSNPSGDIRERQHLEHHEMEKKQSREDSVQGPNPMASGPGSGVPVQEYPMSQHYPYPYGYVQGYPYPVDSSSYHMHMLESDPHYKQQYKQYLDEHHRMYKEQQHHQQQQQLQQHMQQAAAHQQQQQQQQQQVHHGHHQSSHHQGHHQSSKSHHSVIKEERDRSRDSKDRSANLDKMSSSGLMNEHSSKIQHSSNPMVSSKDQDVREVDMRPPSLPAQARIESSASSVALKEKQNENHQILKENIELKSQMEDSKTKINQYEMAMIYERHKEDMRRFYMCQDRMIEQQQQKMEPGIHHHTHHHQTIQSHSQHHASSYSNSSMKSHKDDLSGSVHSKSNHYGDSTRSSVVSPAKSDHIKNLHSTSSPKGGPRDSRDPSMGGPKEYMNSSGRESSSSSSKKESGGGSKNSDSSDKKGAVDKKPEVKVESEGQKPTMETTGPPPPPTNSYAYLHPSYLQPAPPHFAHMPFEPPHAAMYRGGPINPMIVSTPHYPNSPYMHPQIRYVTPGPCDLPVHPPPEAMAGKLHPGAGPPKALDLLHQVSQQYTTTHKIHELSEHAVMSPTPVSSAPSATTTPSNTASSGSSKTSASEPAVVASKGDSGSSRDASRSPPTQRHLHTHHHTHVGVGYPIYDPYGGIITPGPTPTVECKPIHPLQVKPSAPSTAGPRFGWP